MPDQPDIENCIGQRRIAEKPALGHDLDQVNTLETSPTLSRLQTVASKLQVEQQGIERVLENARTDNSYWNIGSMVCYCLYILSTARVLCSDLPSGLPRIWSSPPSQSVFSANLCSTLGLLTEHSS